MAYKDPKDPRMKAARLRHYYKNKEQYFKRNKERLSRLKQWFREYKKTLKCNHCGENHSACLVFHHKNPEEKEEVVCRAVGRGWGKERILKEIAKCEVLCANCHRKEHSRKDK